MPPEIARRLDALGIQVVETANHYLLTRGECLALVERTPTGIGGIGSTGMMTAHGLAYLVVQDGLDMLAAKGSLTQASPEQSAAIRGFSADLKSVLL